MYRVDWTDCNLWCHRPDDCKEKKIHRLDSKSNIHWATAVFCFCHPAKASVPKHWNIDRSPKYGTVSEIECVSVCVCVCVCVWGRRTAASGPAIGAFTVPSSTNHSPADGFRGCAFQRLPAMTAPTHLHTHTHTNNDSRTFLFKPTSTRVKETSSQLSR